MSEGSAEPTSERHGDPGDLDYFWIFENSIECALIHDPYTGEVVRANKRAAEAHGYSQEEMIGLKLDALFAESGHYTPDLAIEKMQRAVRYGREVSEWRIRDRNGEEYPIEATAMPLFDRNRRLLVLVQFREISRRKRLEQEVQRKEEHYRRLLAGSFGGIMIIDLDGTIKYVASSIRMLLGYSEHQLLGANIRPLEHPDERPRIRAFVESLLPGDMAMKQIEYRILHADGSWRHHEANLRNLQSDPEVGGVLVHFRDISSRVEAEVEAKRRSEEMQHLARYKTMAEMGSAIAHEVNQPVAAIRNYAHGCLKKLKSGASGEKIVWAIQQVETEARRASRIIASIRSFTSLSQWQRRHYTIPDIVADIEYFLLIRAREYGAALNLDIARPRSKAWCDKTLVGQVLLNLAMNGMQAMQRIEEADRVLTIAARVKDETYLQLTVADRGCGIPPDVLSSLFTARFTTKESGSGVGLMLSHSIVARHGGQMWAESQVGQGTSVHFTLRRHPDPDVPLAGAHS